ncbi:MAG: hypothetical protein JXR07_20545 [Reichenbachiella sp.]
MRKSTDTKQIHYNIPQITYHLIRAAITICFWGRATGKTLGPGSDFIYNNVLTMPQSLGGIASVTYDKLLTMIIPKLKMGWERFGLINGVHFWIRKYAPDQYRIKRPYLEPADAKHVIHWWNGSANLLVSMDRLGISNALDLDYLYADEGKLFKEEVFAETLLTIRGNADKFGHLSNHGSILITTDLPTNSKGKWLFDFCDEVDQESIDMILMVQKVIFELREKFAYANKKDQRKINSAIAKYEDDINDLRKNLVYVSYASTLDNVHALGIDVIKKFKRTLSELNYAVSVLNQRINQIENGFYSTLDESIHSYVANNIDYQESLNIDFNKKVIKDCRWDADVNNNKPLEIAFDHNAAINWIATGQDDGSTTRLLSAKCVEHPSKLTDLLKKWYEYYKYHSCNYVVYWYDHTSIQDNAKGDISFADEIIGFLDKKGLRVVTNYIGQAPTHRARYYFWQKLLDEDDKDLPTFRYNQSNCEEWQLAMEMTGVKIARDSFEKDKSTEKNKSFPQIEAPHATDATDTLFWGKHSSGLQKTSEFFDILSN